MTNRTGGQLLVESFQQHNITEVFCVPGESYLTVLDALYDTDIDVVVCRQEGGASYMAEAAGQVQDKPGVVMVTRGPGAANALVGVHAAWQHATPLILMVGLNPRGHRHREAFQEFDLHGWFSSTTKSVTILDDAARADELFAKAYRTSMSGRPGPVVIGLPEDVLNEVVQTHAAARFAAPTAAVSDADLNQLTRLLGEASRPLIVVGGSQWDADSATSLTQWAESHAVPIAADFRSQDIIDNRSSAYVGHLGYGRDQHLARLLDESDVVVTIGCVLDDVATDGYQLRQRADAMTIVVHPDPQSLGHLGTIKIHLVVPPATFVTALCERTLPSNPERSTHAVDARRNHHVYTSAIGPSCGHPGVDITNFVRQLQNRLPEDAFITYGAGNYALWPQRFFVHSVFPSLLAPRNGTMGYGVPAAVAAGQTFPHRKVVSFAGDGCFLMNGQEFSTAVQHSQNPLIVVLDNGQYGTIRTHQEFEFPGRKIGTTLHNPNFASLARSFGGHGELVESDDQVVGAIERALNSDQAAILHVKTCTENCLPFS